jgi:DNA polymerase/3'-5' exonuclease PolX
MAAGNPTISFEELSEIASRLERELKSVAQRVASTGALRRSEPTEEIEFVALPSGSAADLFGSAEPDTKAIGNQMGTWGPTTRRGDGTFVCQHAATASTGMRINLRVVVHPLSSESQWGVASAYYTGPATFFRVLAEDLRRNGFILDGEKHTLRKAHGGAVEVPDEETLFRLAGRDFRTPEQRREEVNAALAAQSGNVANTEPLERYHGSEHQGRGMPIERD